MKRIILSILAIVQFFLCMAADNVGASERIFTHPGSIISNEDIDNIKLHVDAKEQPWLNEWNALVAAYGSADYVASGNTEIGGSGGNRQRACRDALAAMYNAVIWRVRGTDANAQCAAQILSAWGNKCVSAKDELFQFPCLDMCIAAECLRNADGSFYRGWAETDRNNFMNMVRNVFVPALRGQSYNRLPSWSAPAIAGMMAAGILLDDEAIYKEALNDVMATNGTKSGNIYNAIGNNGQVWEMGRDNVHAMLCVDDLIRMAQMAWNQSDDLWAAGNNRILKGVDYWCGYNSCHTDIPWNEVPSAENGSYRWFYVSLHNNAFRLRPDGTNYELAFHHYKEVMKMDEANYPYLASFTKLARPETNYHTLLYARSIETSPLATEKPRKPQGVKAVACKGFNTISWQHPSTEDQRDYYVYRSMDGITWNTIYSASYNTCNWVMDYDVKEGCTYYYKVKFKNYAGTGEISDACSCYVGSQAEKLPEGWKVASVSGKVPATASYSAQNHHSFTLQGGGREIYYGDDGCGFLYYTMKGDGCITARIVNCSGYQNGLMMRKTLDSGAIMAALKLGGKGGRYLEMWNRVNAGDGKPNMLLGSDYTHVPFWMRLERKGNVFTSYVSKDGKVWEKVASQSLSMGTGDYYAGIFVCNDKNTTGGQLTINVDNVSIENGEQQKIKAPTSLTAEAKSSSRINLKWDAVEDAECYTIIRYQQDEKEPVIVAEGIASTAYSDSLLMPSTAYRYGVIAENWSGMGVDTVFVEQTTPQQVMPSKPLVKVMQNTLNSAKLVWNAQDEATTYNIYRGILENSDMELVAENIQGTFYVNSDLKTGSTYYYKVQAVNGVGETSSEVASVAIKKYARFAYSYRINDGYILVDCGVTTRSKSRFLLIKPLTDQAWKLKGAQIQMANNKEFVDAENVGTIDEVFAKNIASGLPTEIPNSYYKYLRIIPKYTDLTTEDFNIQCYGDTIRLRTQKIEFQDLSPKTTADADFDAGAKATSGLPVYYTSTVETVATVLDNGLIHIVAPGKCYIVAHQDGDNTVWAAATTVRRTLTVTEPTAIILVADDNNDADTSVYDLQGRKVATHLHQALRNGVYIYQGKKITIR